MPVRILYLGLLAAALAAAGLHAGEPAGDYGPAVTLRTREGSLLRGFLSSNELVFEKDDGSTERLAWKDVASVELAERIDAKDAEAARAAVAELASENYQIRQKAQQRLEDLGRGAAPALRAGAKSKDPEVAIRARELLAKMGGAGSSASGDRVTATKGPPREGTVAAESYELRTAHGTIVLPAESVGGLRVLNAKDAAPLLAAAKHWPAPGEKKIVGLVPVWDDAKAEPWMRPDLVLPGLTKMGATRAGYRVLTVNACKGANVGIKEGDSLDGFFDKHGLLVKPTDPKGKLAAGPAPFAGAGEVALVIAGEGASESLEIGFTDAGKPVGVQSFAFLAVHAGGAPLTWEAYDRRDRLLKRFVVEPNDNEGQGPVLHGVQAAVPIYRIRIHRESTPDAGSMAVGSFIFSPPLTFEHDTRLDCVALASGEWLVGKLETVGEGKDRIAIRPAFLPKDAPSIGVDMKDVATVVPALSEAADVKEEDVAEPLDKEIPPLPGEVPRAGPFVPHGILLQNGDRLMALLLKLDAESVVLELPGKVELKLPRAALRKVDLRPGTPLAPPPAADEGDAKGQGEAKAEGDAKGEGEKKAEDKVAPSADPLDPEHVKKEKTGVEFAQRTATAAGKTSTEGMPRMDNAEILSIDARKNALTVDPKDGGPPWPIDLHSARFLVFPEAAAPAAGNAGGWELTLRIGSRFAFELQGLDANGVRGKLAGGEVAMPWSAIESLQRTRPEAK